MRVFVIGGKSGSGKNTVANLIKDYYDNIGEKTIITEFSKYIKLYAKEMIGWNYDVNNKPRKFLQNMGQKVRKTLGEDIFINRMKEDISIYQEYFDNVVISDARLINEIDAFKEYYLKCYSIHVESSKDNKLTEEEKNHITELELDDYKDFDYNIDYVLEDQLKQDVENILEELK